MRSAEAIEETEVVIELGGIGIDMEFDEVRQLLYITVPALNEVVFLSTLTYEIVDRVVVGSRPHGIDLSNDGSQLFVALNQAGSVVILDPDTSDITEVIVGDVVGDARVWDVIEGKENRVFVSANPSSSGLAYIGMIKLDEGNAVVRVASNARNGERHRSS
jgi:DNA-binding beta-propeller fold protein YncE